MNTVREISNRELTLADIPSPDADWGVIGEFALTYNGYDACKSFDECAEIANAHQHRSLADLRTCIFFEQRRWRHFGCTPDQEAMAYILDVLEKIRTCVATGNLD